MIEDDIHIASILLNGFQQEGISVTHSTDGVDGLHEAITQDFDVIILDIMLPKKDGFEVLAELRGQGSLLL